MVGFYREKRTKLRHRGTIWGMYVIPEQRHQGIGKKLLLELINRIKLLPNLEQVYLSVVTTNKEARNLYISLGFKPYGFDRNALKLNNKYLDEENMVFSL
jgi:ribosomal protein S18 acetylase RimI-like enzyme